MRRLEFRSLLPDRVDTYRGARWAVPALVLYNIAGTGRSLVHVFAPDSGAHTVATIDTTVEGGSNSIALLGQWGGSQLVMAGVIWVVVARYRGLVPLMLAEAVIEQVLRFYVGQTKPLVTVHTPPGAAGTKIAFVLCTAALVASLLPARSEHAELTAEPGTTTPAVP